MIANSENLKPIAGHPTGLFTLFFTEMWERFSYYGMRALLVLFLVTELAGGGWGWTNEAALKLYALYTGLVYLTPILGGFLADKMLGFRNAVVLGALLMTLGHASMAMETEFFFYLGLGLLIFGNGFFKPNISSIVGNLYKDDGKKKDAGYTIFYMGINAGAFLGILLCGYIGEKVDWSLGFGMAGIFMLLGMLQFYFGQGIFGKIGKAPKKMKEEANANKAESPQKQSETESKKEETKPHIVRDRLTVIIILSLFTIFFWMAFEQAGGSMSIFAKDFTNRILIGGAATAFTVINTALTLVPLVVVTIVLGLLFARTIKKYPLSVFFLGLSFVIIWGAAIWMLNREFQMNSYQVEYNKRYEQTIKTDKILETGTTVFILEDKEQGAFKIVDPAENKNAIKASIAEKTELSGIKKDKAGGADFEYSVTYQSLTTDKMRDLSEISKGTKISIIEVGDNIQKISKEKAAKFKNDYNATVVKEAGFATQVPASWFGILNSFFIILFAPLFSKLWETKLNPPGPIKFALGLTLLGIGFGALAFGSRNIELGAEAASVSMVWLVLAYLFHTLGELCLSPVGLSYVSKLAPAKLVGLMFGFWFAATAVANYLAGFTGSFIDKISDKYGLSAFFLIYLILPVFSALVLVLLTPFLRKKMHGIR